MQIIFCANPIDRSKPDSLYESEAEAAARLNFTTSLINFEALVDENDPAKAIRKVRRPAESGGCANDNAIYRGWMLTPEQYKKLYDELSHCGIELINDPQSYKHCHYLPEWLELVKEKTPKTIWITKEELGQREPTNETQSQKLDDLLKEKLAPFGANPVIVKDYVKSEKHHWHDACFIPDASDHTNVLSVTAKFLQLRGTALEGGLVFRQFIKFQTLTTHSKSAMPLTKEFRLFVLDGKIIHWFNYWEEGDYQGLQPPIEQFSELVQRPRSRFFTMDIAQTMNGEWLVVELGDAQVSGLPENTSPEAFYQAIAISLTSLSTK
jgi:hypothetical protein